MKAPISSFWEWQKRCPNNDEACLAEIAELFGPDDFQCPHCWHSHGWQLNTASPVIECTYCHKQIFVTAGRLFHASKVSWPRWFWAIYCVSSDKGSISALRLLKLIEVSWRTAHKMLCKSRTAMGHQDSQCRLHGVIELDDALIGGKRTGKRGRGAAGKTPVIVSCEHNHGRPGFVVLQAEANVNHTTTRQFAKSHLGTGQTIHTDALNACNTLAEPQHHIASVPSPEKASEWLPSVHVLIRNFKAFSRLLCLVLTMVFQVTLCRNILMSLPIGSTDAFGMMRSPTVCSG